jgi:hypothetical protein
MQTPADYVPRSLWRQVRDERVAVPEVEIPRIVEPVVILGEAGMGKTTLLRQLAVQKGYALCTARQLVNRPDPISLLGEADVLVIDALDEMGTQRDGDSVDAVIRQLGVLRYPRFILACRVAEWRNATSAEAIQEQYNTAPAVLHLLPLSDDEVKGLLEARLSSTEADAVIKHFERKGLGSLLSNPQTLLLIAEVANAGRLPESRSELFAQAIDTLRQELKPSKAATRPPVCLEENAAGAAFAALIVTGSEALERGLSPARSAADLQISEITRLPEGASIATVLDTRLFRAEGADRFTYWHRRIGEFLGARWLANQASTGRKRRRILNIFHAHAMVPASLRGIHAWLAMDANLAADVIQRDPTGVLEYGPADTLSSKHMRLLVRELRNAAIANPYSSEWGSDGAVIDFAAELQGEMAEHIKDRTNPLGFRLLLVKAVKGSAARRLEQPLCDLVLDQSEGYVVRSAAIETLSATSGKQVPWGRMLEALASTGESESARLGIEILHRQGFSNASDLLIVSLVTSVSTSEHHVAGVLLRLEQELPDDRIDVVLDLLSEAASAIGKAHERPGDDELTNFLLELLHRRLAVDGVVPARFWKWIEPFDLSSGYRRERQEAVAQHLRRDHVLRRGVQALVLITQPSTHTIWQRAHRLSARSDALFPNEDDVVCLLDAAATQGNEWRDLLLLIPHSNESGLSARKAAKAVVADDPELSEWIDALANPTEPEWKAEQQKREASRARALKRQKASHRRSYSPNASRAAAGDLRFLIQPAKAYLRLFHDIDADLLPHLRIADWLGPKNAAAAHAGFESYLKDPSSTPTAHEIAQSLAEGKYYEAERVYVAALAERHRKAAGFRDLSDDRVLSGLFALHGGWIAEHAGISGLSDALEAEIERRGLTANARRAYFEPQLSAGRAHISGLSNLMSGRASAYSAGLAIDWLERFDSISGDACESMICRVIRSDLHERLVALARSRISTAPEALRCYWQAALLMVDFAEASERLVIGPDSKDLVWTLRDWTTGDRHDFDLSIPQLEWIISKFRPLWTVTPYPVGGWSGDRNRWDATEYLRKLVRRLGADSSPQAAEALTRLRDSCEDGYSDGLRAVWAEQLRATVERTFQSPSLDTLAAIVSDSRPKTIEDLQAFMLEELALAQRKIASDDIDSWRGFFDGCQPADEERCTDHLLGILRQGCEGVQLDPETHVGGNKEVDFTCSVGQLRLPVEAKGQWHADLWKAPANQLKKLYSSDWRAGGRGIYLVYWFGADVPTHKKAKSRGRGSRRPGSVGELQASLTSVCRSSGLHGLEVVVLDVSRRSP